MTAKEQFRLADSIIRYDFRGGFTTSFNFDDSRDTLTEMAMIPNEIIGAVYRARAVLWKYNASGVNHTGRIMFLYKQKHGSIKVIAGRAYELADRQRITDD